MTSIVILDFDHQQPQRQVITHPELGEVATIIETMNHVGDTLYFVRANDALLTVEAKEWFWEVMSGRILLAGYEDDGNDWVTFRAAEYHVQALAHETVTCRALFAKAFPEVTARQDDAKVTPSGVPEREASTRHIVGGGATTRVPGPRSPTTIRFDFKRDADGKAVLTHAERGEVATITEIANPAGDIFYRASPNYDLMDWISTEWANYRAAEYYALALGHHTVVGLSLYEAEFGESA